MNTPLDPELIKKIQDIESRSPANKQLQVLADIAVMMQELINLADDEKDAKESDVEQFGAVLLDIRESLKAIKDREDPESQDYATPVVEAVSKLEKSFANSIKKIEVKPVVNVPKQDIKVAAPVVNVDAPKIDLSGVVSLLKSELPKAFEKAIKLIPKNDVVIPEAPDRWDEVLQWLESIDTASRMKPEAPTQVKVVNPDGTYTGVNLVDVPYDYVGMSNADGNGNYQTVVYKTGGSGGTTVRTLTYTFDASNNVTSITRS